MSRALAFLGMIWAALMIAIGFALTVPLIVVSALLEGANAMLEDLLESAAATDAAARAVWRNRMGRPK